MSLARLYKNQGKREEGRVLLTSIYDSFTEGLDTTELREAKTLLDDFSKTQEPVMQKDGPQEPPLKTSQPEGC